HVKVASTPLLHETVQSGRQESNLPRTAYQTVASPPGPRPDSSAPCTGLEPVSPARQAGRHTRCVTGHKSVRRPALPPVHRGRVVPRLLGHGHPKQGRKESNPLRVLWRHTALPGARPCRAEGTGVEPARACASAAFRAAAVSGRLAPPLTK